MTRVLAAALAVSTSLLSGADVTVTRLEPGRPVERTLAAGDRHKYEIALDAGQTAILVIEQRGIDVVLQTVGEGDTLISEFDDEPRRTGDEHGMVVADKAGRYSVVVTPAIARPAPGSYSIRVSDLRAATPRDRTLDEVRKLRASASRLSARGKETAAIPLLRRALTLSESVAGPRDLDLALVLRDLAGVYVDTADYAAAEPLYVRALGIMDAAIGLEHPAAALASSQLGVADMRLGRRPDAERLIQRALDVLEPALGPDHMYIARCLVALGTLRYEAADFDKAEQIERRALVMMERMGETDKAAYSTVLNNLGVVAVERKDYATADRLYRQSLALDERREGEESYTVTAKLQNLGVLARQRKDYAEAEALYLRALRIREKVVGPGHPHIAALLNNLALIYRDRGDVAKSIETHLRALDIREQSVGPYSEAVLQSLGNIARTYAAVGDAANALAFQRRADSVLETQLALNLAIGSERQKLAFAENMSDRLDRTISLNLDLAPGDPGATALAALGVLQRKGRVLDAMADTLGTLRERVGEGAERELLDDLAATTTRLARLSLNGAQNMSPEQRQKAQRDLEERKERLESTISERSAEFRARSQPVTLAAVQAAIPADAALLEFAFFRPFDPKSSTNDTAYGAPHYVVYLIAHEEPPRGMDLGPADAIDAAVTKLRTALRDPKRADVKRLARALDDRVLEPVRRSLGKATRLLVSPDGELNLIPFETLVDADGHYAVERYSISYLTSGRDLLRMQFARPSTSAPVVIADPVFGSPQNTQDGERAGSAAARRQRSTNIGVDLSNVYFAPLSGTADEAKTIQSLFPETTVLTGRDATKAALSRLKAPRILHVASHGFFLQDAGGRGANPLLRSGLALAGANVKQGGPDGGILTAMEATNLNLWGTSLVTLSACDTGVGEVRDREGVYGLRRAFLLAGAETIVMSLWPVSDYVTGKMMAGYYQGLKRGLGRGDALRQAQLAMLARPGRRHPFYWASFIQEGDWRPLDQKWQSSW